MTARTGEVVASKAHFFVLCLRSEISRRLVDELCAVDDGLCIRRVAELCLVYDAVFVDAYGQPKLLRLLLVRHGFFGVEFGYIKA